MKKFSLMILMLIVVAMTANAQGFMGMGMGMRPNVGMFPDNRDADTIAVEVAKEMKLEGELCAKFISVYKAYQLELKKLDELLPLNFPRERGQRPTQEQMEQMQQTFQAREKVTTELRQIYEEKFVEVLGEKELKHLQKVEDALAQKRMQQMMNRRGRRGGGGFQGGGFPGGGFPGM